MQADGVRRAACFTTSAYSSYSSCRQYREDLADAVGRQVRRRRRGSTSSGCYFNHPGFLEPVVDAIVAALGDGGEVREDARLVFVTHSIPTVDERRQRADAAAPTSTSTSTPRRTSPSGSPRPPAAATTTTWSSARAPGRRRCRGSSPTSTTTSSGSRVRGRALGGAGPARLRLRPHGGRLRPRHRGAGDRRAARPATPSGWRRRAPTRGSSRWSATCSLERAAVERGEDRRAGRRRRLAGDLGPLRRGLLPQPARARRP